MINNCFLLNQCNGKDCDKVFCLRRYKMEALLKSSLIAPKYWKKEPLFVDEDETDLKEFKRLAHIEEDIENFVKKGYNLFIHSPIPGNGKTSWARRMILSYFEHTWPLQDLTDCKALFIQVSPFLQALKDNISIKNPEIQYVKEYINTADIVVWDDLGTEIGTDYDINQLLGFIDKRTAAGKTNIYTSNLTRQEMEFKVGKRLASRVGMSIDIELKGKDKRVVSAQTEEY